MFHQGRKAGSNLNVKLKIILLVILMVIPMGLVVSANPSISGTYPLNGATNIPIQSGTVSLRANITAINLSYIRFETNKTGTWQKISDFNVTGNWTSGNAVNISGLLWNTKYYWKIFARDSLGNWTNSTFSFTTKKLDVPIGNEITIIPSVPRADKNIIFLIDKTEASGYLLINGTGNLYLIDFKNKIGMVELGMEYGKATLFIVDYGEITFNISSPYAGELYIDAPSELDINQKGDFTVIALGGEQVSVKLRMISPTGREKTKTTSATGPLQLSFDEVGNWTLIAEMYDVVVTSRIDIMPKPLTIGLPRQNDLKVGEEITIGIGTLADVVISKDEAMWTYQSDGEGNVYFTPPLAGRYLITATTSTQSGTKYFNVLTDLILSIKNDKGLPVTNVKKNDFLVIQATDETGNSVDLEDVSVYADGSLWKTLDLTGGLAYWQVDTDANQYSFEISDTNYNSASMILPGIVATSSIPNKMQVPYYYYYIVIAIVIIIILVIVAQKRGWINIKSLSGILGKEEDEEESLL